jgi:hypothetical protein
VPLMAFSLAAGVGLPCRQILVIWAKAPPYPPIG